jgi:hypothetical protein
MPVSAKNANGIVVLAEQGRDSDHQRGNRDADHEHEEAEHRPADRGGDRTAVLPREREGGERSREDRDDREGDREVGESRPRARQLLL